MSELKCCPFCGGQAILCDDIEYTVGGYWIECKDCHIQTPSRINSKEVVIEYWNMRKPIDRIEEQLEQHRAKFNCKICKHFTNGKEECNEDCTDALIEDLINIVRKGGVE